MVIQTLLLAYAAALICLTNAEKEWKPVPFGAELPIDFDTSNLQLRMIGFADSGTRNKQLWIYFNAGEDKDAGGMEISHGNFLDPDTNLRTDKNGWRLLGCGAAGTMEGAKGEFTEEQMSKEPNKEEIYTIWREDTVLLNLMINDNAILDNYAVLDETTDESCDRDDTFWRHKDRMDFAEDYRKKVTSIKIEMFRTTGSEADVLTGYRIVTREDKDGEEGGEEGGDDKNESYTNGGTSPGQLLNILMTLSTALAIALTFF